MPARQTGIEIERQTAHGMLDEEATFESHSCVALVREEFIGREGRTQTLHSLLAGILAPLPARCVTLGKLPRLSVGQLTQFDNGVGPRGGSG